LYPGFGFRILEWITCLCRTSRKRQNTRVSNRIVPESCYLCVPQCEEHQILTGEDTSDQFITLTGLLEAQRLTFTVSTNTNHSISEVKSALTWMLTVLQPRGEHMKGLFYVPWDDNSLDDGRHNLTRFNPSMAESYCWTRLFSYAIITDLPLSKASNDLAKEGLEVDLDLLVELATMDREMEIDGGIVRYGFDMAIVPLKPVKSRRWYFFRTEGRQITSMRAKNELKKLRLSVKFELVGSF